MTTGYVITLTLGVATWLLPSVGDDGDLLFQYNKKNQQFKSYEEDNFISVLTFDLYV
jgi:hypothetical protein